MARQAAPQSAAGLLAPSELGFLSLLLGTNLAALAADIMMCALYPGLALRFGAPVETVVLLGTPRALAQLGVLALGPLADRIGRARVLVGGLFLIAAAAWSGAVAPNLGSMAAVQVALGLGFAIVMAGVPALAGDRYPYEIRGRVLAIVRLAMPFTLMVVVPALVALAARRTTAAPFMVLGTATAALSLLAAWRLPRLGGPSSPVGPDAHPAGWLSPRVIVILLLGLCLAIVPTSVFGFLAAWIGGRFGDPAHTVGLALTFDGLGALGGVGLSVFLVDRLTKRRAGILGLALAAAFAFSLFAAQRALLVAVLAIAGFSASLEVGFIALSALLTEVAPQARATAMSLWAAALALGAALAPPLARLLWLQRGMAAIGWAGGVLLLAVAAVLAMVAVEPGTTDEHE